MPERCYWCTRPAVIDLQMEAPDEIELIGICYECLHDTWKEEEEYA